MGSKMGRPVIGNLKNNDIKVRIDDETLKKLLEYCEKKEITKAEAIRQGIYLLLKK
ncbi:CopG family transcriptional regulator [Fusobacterium polymorphum]|uniref:CopG family transcriptional regulator n=2 Tax=Fusobacterium TaxID=848 RepID=A0A2C6BGX1_FUSNP|nr:MULTISPECIES: CopG family transcriptional regulator [Fusobacterium]PHI03503.1 CopG family transcriptional regulator [Fusobacterium polymorphum]